MPIGSIMWYPRSTPPDGWLVCNGQSTAAYPQLAAIVGATVPDLRGEFIRGWDAGKGIDPGRLFGSWQDDRIKQHTHTYGATSAQYGPDWRGILGGGATPGFTTGGVSDPTVFSSETRPRNIALLPCIKHD